MEPKWSVRPHARLYGTRAKVAAPATRHDGHHWSKGSCLLTQMHKAHRLKVPREVGCRASFAGYLDRLTCATDTALGTGRKLCQFCQLDRSERTVTRGYRSHVKPYGETSAVVEFQMSQFYFMPCSLGCGARCESSDIAILAWKHR